MLIYKEEQLIELIKAFAGGDDSSFDKIGALIHQDIINIAYRYIGNLEDAKDILQSVLIKLYKKLKFFRKASKFSTWVYRITINTSIDFIRKRNRIYNLNDRFKKNKDEQTSSRDKIDLKDKARMVREALAVLPLRQKNAFILRHYQGLPIEKISSILGCSQSAVKTHLARAIMSLKKKVGGRP